MENRKITVNDVYPHMPEVIWALDRTADILIELDFLLRYLKTRGIDPGLSISVKPVQQGKD